MKATYLVLLLGLMATGTVCQIFIGITSPCLPGKVPTQNSVPITVNGCGGNSWQAAIGSVLNLFFPYLTSCCNGHDYCFAKCAASSFTSAFNSCNSALFNCIKTACNNLIGDQRSYYSKRDSIA